MARLSYAHTENLAPAEAAIVERITRERGGKMLNLYKMLMHSPPVADGWRGLFTAIRQQGELSDRLRELAIMRVAVLNDASYEFAQHIPFAQKSGFSDAQIEAMKATQAPNDTTHFAALELAVLAYTDAMTRNIRVPDAVFAALRPSLNQREIVELTTTVAGYNLVSRFLEALQIDHE